MTFFLSILAGVIGANFVAGLWPARTLAGVLNIALGLLGGVLVWAASTELANLIPSMSSFILIMVLGAAGGAMLTLGGGSLRNILSGDR